jgi:hypothetical protein
MRKAKKFHSLLHSVAGAKGLFFFHYPEVNLKDQYEISNLLEVKLLTAHQQAL